MFANSCRCLERLRSKFGSRLRALFDMHKPLSSMKRASAVSRLKQS
jgi:hypothetical protein